MVDTTEVNFGTVKFIQPCTQTLAIANTGQVPVQFEFIQKPGEESYCKPWLQAEPYSGFIMPGTEKSVFRIFRPKTTYFGRCTDKCCCVRTFSLLGWVIV